jgi:hypothetical protein
MHASLGGAHGTPGDGARGTRGEEIEGRIERVSVSRCLNER